MKNHIYAMIKKENHIFSFLLQEGKAVEIHCDKTESDTILGNIYIGKIKNIAKNIGAAFVEIAPGNICYLALDDMKDPVYTKKGTSKLPQAGDELLVQVSREGIKTKFPSVTTNITLYGKYALLTTGNKQVSVSSKLSQRQKERLYGFVKRLENEADVNTSSQENATGVNTKNTSSQEIATNVNTKNTSSQEIATDVNTKNTSSQENATGVNTENTSPSAIEELCSSNSASPSNSKEVPKVRRYGWLLRTNAGTAPEEFLKKDMFRLQSQYEVLMQQAQHRTCFSSLVKTPSAYLSRLSNLYDTADVQIITDDADLYQEITGYLISCQPEDLPKLSFYEDKLLPMHKLYSLEHQLQQALSERVWMNSGGYLVIQPTEALTVIDVNTGKYEGGKKKEAAFLKINLEAAVEIARQIRLRNISGIVVVDFINMESKEAQRQLLEKLDAELKKDPVKTVLVDMTKLSLVEITRMKKERPLAEQCRNGFSTGK